MELKVNHLNDDPGLFSDFGGQNFTVSQLNMMYPVVATLCHCWLTGCARHM
jgi:hypothetical protein